MRHVLAALLAVAALPASAAAHGNEPVIPQAVAALQQGSIYVDYDARPSLTELEADRLGSRLDARGHVFVAVLPASASEEIATSPSGIAAALGEKVGRDGTYVVSVGGRLGTWTNVLAPDHVDSLVAEVRGTLDERLTSVVAGLPDPPIEEESNWTAFAIAATAILALSGALLLVVRHRRARALERVRRDR